VLYTDFDVILTTGEILFHTTSGVEKPVAGQGIRLPPNPYKPSSSFLSFFSLSGKEDRSTR
jgi:hypothetical protein